MDKTIRTFVAVELNPEIQQALKDIQRYLKKSGADVKWVNPENIHLTLKFIGEIPVKHIPNIQNIICSCAQAQNPFLLELTHLGAFPKREHPRVIWVGLHKGKKELSQLAVHLEERLQSLGLQKEKRKFDPHATLGRVRSGINRHALVKAMEEWSFEKRLVQEIRHVILYKSTLTAQGPIYEPLQKSIFLKKS